MASRRQAAACFGSDLPAPARIFKRPAAHFCYRGWNRRPVSIHSPLTNGVRVQAGKEGVMGIDRESDTAANLVIGPTSLGMVRIFVEAEGIDLPMDFEPDEALEIADELRAAAERARAVRPRSGPAGGKRKGGGRDPGGRRG